MVCNHGKQTELLAGGIAASTTALAGCTFDFEFGTGDPDNDDNGDDNDENQTFAIDEMRFTTERAQAFGDYDERTDGIFTGGEDVYFYWELSNVREANGDAIQLEYSITGPDGEEQLSPEQDISIDDLSDSPADVFVTDGVETADLGWYEPGDYEVDVTMTELATDDTDTITESFTIEEMRIDAVTFVDEQTEEEKDEPVYQRGEEYVQFNTDILGAPVDEDDSTELEISFDITDPEGEPWESDTVTQTWDDAGFQRLIYERGYETFDDDPVGEYEMDIHIEEQITGDQYADSTDVTFELE